MKFIRADFFEYQFQEKITAIITDPPYKDCIANKLNEQHFDVLKFLQKADDITKKDAVLIVFTNMAMVYDLRLYAHQTNWIYKTYQIWNKEPIRTWVSWNKPLKSLEFILYFIKGDFDLCFKDGTIKPSVTRSSFGGKLKDTTPNSNSRSFGMYSEIVTFPSDQHKIHPTQKPKKFSKMFKQIIGDVESVLDPFCGSGSLLHAFPTAIGLDIKDWTETNNRKIDTFLKIKKME